MVAANVQAAPARSTGLSGSERVAVIALALGQDQAATLLKRFEDEEQQQIVRAMIGIGHVPPETVEQVLGDFVEKIDTRTLFGSIAQAEKILLKLMPPEKVRDFIGDLNEANATDTWERLRSVSDPQLAAFLRSEHPQTSALVVTRLTAAQAARVLKQLPEPLAQEIITRTLSMTPVARPVIEEVERVLRTEFLSANDRNRSIDAHALVADIFNEFDRQLEETMLQNLEAEMPESAERIRSLMFAFEDLQEFDDAGIEILLRNLSPDLLPLALKGAAPQMMDLFLRSMPERAARMLKDEIANTPKVRARDVEAARREIIAACKQLIAAGEITAAEKDDGDWVD